MSRGTTPLRIFAKSINIKNESVILQIAKKTATELRLNDVIDPSWIKIPRSKPLRLSVTVKKVRRKRKGDGMRRQGTSKGILQTSVLGPSAK